MFLTVMYIVGFSYNFNNLIGVPQTFPFTSEALDEAAETRRQPSTSGRAPRCGAGGR